MHSINEVHGGLVKPSIEEISELLIGSSILTHKLKDCFFNFFNWHVTFKRLIFSSHLSLKALSKVCHVDDLALDNVYKGICDSRLSREAATCEHTPVNFLTKVFCESASIPFVHGLETELFGEE